MRSRGCRPRGSRLPWSRRRSRRADPARRARISARTPPSCAAMRAPRRCRPQGCARWCQRTSRRSAARGGRRCSADGRPRRARAPAPDRSEAGHSRCRPCCIRRPACPSRPRPKRRSATAARCTAAARPRRSRASGRPAPASRSCRARAPWPRRSRCTARRRRTAP